MNGTSTPTNVQVKEKCSDEKEPEEAKQEFRLKAFESPMRLFKAREWHQSDGDAGSNSQLERQLVVTSDQLLILKVRKYNCFLCV